jgi:hypothetical protein
MRGGELMELWRILVSSIPRGFTKRCHIRAWSTERGGVHARGVSLQKISYTSKKILKKSLKILKKIPESHHKISKNS